MPTLTETLTWLVDIPSETGQESRIRDAIADRLSGLAVTKIGESLLVGEPGPDTVILAGHIDTVPLQGHVGSRLEDDRLHGLGATDMKGGLAVMIHLLEDLDARGLIGIFYAGEEGPMSGNQLVRVLSEFPSLAQAGAAIVLEPTNRELQAGCQGAINARVWFEGASAHSARPWLGVNAVTKAGAFLEEMHERDPDPHIVEGLEFREVVSITRASGGVANNVIPPLFEVNVNYRFAPDRSIEDAIDNLRRICAAADGFEVADTAPAAYPDAAHPLFEALAAAAGSRITSKQGWTDVAQLAQLGVPAVNFGPGETSLAHRPGESVRLDDLDWAYDALYEVLETTPGSDATAGSARADG